MAATTIPWDPNEVTGPEISTPELHGEGMVAPGQEELAKEFEEGPQATDEEKILGKFSPNCVDLISKMVCYDPDARITGTFRLSAALAQRIR